MPRLAPNQGLSSIEPSGSKSGSVALARITAVSAAGMWAMLVTTAPFAENTGLSGVYRPSTPNLSMNQRSLAAASSSPPAIAPAWPTARVRRDFQRPTTQATTGLVKSASRS